MINPPQISLRLFSDDQYVVDKVLYSNFYRTKRIPSDSIVVDVGAHIGTFSIQMAILGAKKVYAYEPLKANYEILMENARSFIGIIDPNNIAVLFQNSTVLINHPEFKEEGRFFNFNKVDIEDDKRPSDFMPCLTLSTILRSIKEPEIQILKINTGSHELDILKNCGDELKRVKHICGETTCTDIKLIEEAIENLKSLGFAHSWMLKTEEESHLFIFSREPSENQFKIEE